MACRESGTANGADAETVRRFSLHRAHISQILNILAGCTTAMWFLRKFQFFESHDIVSCGMSNRLVLPASHPAAYAIMCCVDHRKQIVRNSFDRISNRVIEIEFHDHRMFAPSMWLCGWYVRMRKCETIRCHSIHMTTYIAYALNSNLWYK